MFLFNLCWFCSAFIVRQTLNKHKIKKLLLEGFSSLTILFIFTFSHAFAGQQNEGGEGLKVQDKKNKRSKKGLHKMGHRVYFNNNFQAVVYVNFFH